MASEHVRQDSSAHPGKRDPQDDGKLDTQKVNGPARVATNAAVAELCVWPGQHGDGRDKAGKHVADAEHIDRRVVQLLL